MKSLITLAINFLLAVILSMWAMGAEVDISVDPNATNEAIPMRSKLNQAAANFDELYRGGALASTLTYASTTNVDFTAAHFQTVTLTGNVTFTTSHLAAGQTVVLRVIASGGSRNVTMPAWINLGASAPTAVASGKTGLYVLRSFGTTDGAVVYRYEVQP